MPRCWSAQPEDYVCNRDIAQKRVSRTAQGLVDLHGVLHPSFKSFFEIPVRTEKPACTYQGLWGVSSWCRGSCLTCPRVRSGLLQKKLRSRARGSGFWGEYFKVRLDINGGGEAKASAPSFHTLHWVYPGYSVPSHSGDEGRHCQLCVCVLGGGAPGLWAARRVSSYSSAHRPLVAGGGEPEVLIPATDERSTSDSRLKEA